MALRTRRQYESFRRSAGSMTSLSSYATTLARKQQAAEDDQYDNRYSQGLMDASAYLGVLRERQSRPYLTPLQKENLVQRMDQVTQDYNDSLIQNAYKTGSTVDGAKVDDRYMYTYENAKLQKMTPNSEAYNTQAVKVQNLKDKYERAERSAYRVSQNLKIAQMPEDSSARMYEKANLYEQLENQARLDGDAQAADSFAAQKINYQNSAKKAEINDMIAGVRLDVSDDPNVGLGVPTAEGGASALNGGTGAGSMPSGAGGEVAGNSTGGGLSYTSPMSSAVQNKMKSLDANQKSLERLYGSRSEKIKYINAYTNAVNQATGDQRTSLMIALNNHKGDLANIENEIAKTEARTGELIEGIQEAQQAAAYSSFSKEVRTNLQQFSTKEDELEREFTKGNLSKEEYIEKAYSLADTKQQFFDAVSQGYGQFGKDYEATQYDEKKKNFTPVLENLAQVAANPDMYEPVVVDKGSSVTNILGQPKKVGDVTLKNVSALKENGMWDVAYVPIGGKFYKVNSSQLQYDANGDPLPMSVQTDLGKITGKGTINVVDEKGKITKQPVTFTQYQNDKGMTISKPIPDSVNLPGGKTLTVEQLKKTGYYKDDGKGNLVRNYNGEYIPQKGEAQAPNILNKLGFEAPSMENLKQNVGFLGKAAQSIAKGAGDFLTGKWIKPTLEGMPGKVEDGKYYPFAKTMKNPVTGEAEGFLDRASQIVAPPVYGDDGVKKAMAPITNSVNQTRKLIAQALKEQGIYSPEVLNYAMATIQHETADSFSPVNEGFYNDEKYGYDSGFTGRSQAQKLGYSGGENFFGRGFIQLTHDYNYKKIGQMIGMGDKLYKNPDLANDPKVAAKILAAYFKDRGIDKKVTSGDIIGARQLVNPDNNGQLVADYYNAFKTQAPVAKSQVLAAESTQKSLPMQTPTPMPTKAPQPKSSSASSAKSATAGFYDKAKQAQEYYNPSDTNKNGQVDWGESTIGQAVNSAASSVKSGVSNAAQQVSNWVSNIVSPKIISPIPNYKPAPAPKPAPKPAPQQSFVQKATSAVQNVAKSVGSWFSNLFKKK